MGGGEFHNNYYFQDSFSKLSRIFINYFQELSNISVIRESNIIISFSLLNLFNEESFYHTSKYLVYLSVHVKYLINLSFVQVKYLVKSACVHRQAA